MSRKLADALYRDWDITRITVCHRQKAPSHSSWMNQIMAERKRRNVLVEGEKLRGAEKVKRIPVKVIPTVELPAKPDWIRVKIPAPKISHIKQKLREHRLASVCEEASCPNLGECFSNGTATFMIMGDICTRRCPFCDVAHGKPRPLDPNEPTELARAIQEMDLSYVVITSQTETT